MEILVILVKDDIIPHIVDIENPQMYWTTLHNLQESNNGTQTLFPFDKIHGIALDENISMIKFVGKVKEITTKNWCKLGDMY